VYGIIAGAFPFVSPVSAHTDRQRVDMDVRYKVPVSLSQELIKSIRILAKNGRESFRSRLYEPLRYSGWQGGQSDINVRKSMERILLESANPAFLSTVGPRCKRLVMHAMNESYSALGDASIFFLERMQIHVKISGSAEAIEFVDIIKNPLSEFLAVQSEKNETLFEKAITSINTDDLKAAFEPVRLEASREKVRLGGEIKRLYDNILIASRYNNIIKCRKLLSNYIIRYSDEEDYAREDVDRLVAAMDKREPGFEKDLMDQIAVDLHYRITQGILNGDIPSAVQGIRKYGYIFEGNAGAKHFYDIDRLERILYKMITDKNLWDTLKGE
jgi:hypothetical protein